MKRRFFLSVFFTVFLDCRSTNLLRLVSGNLPAMFKYRYQFSFLQLSLLNLAKTIALSDIDIDNSNTSLKQCLKLTCSLSLLLLPYAPDN